jgi:hypothetical protein
MKSRTEDRWARRGVMVIAMGAASLLSFGVAELPAGSASTGSNQSTVNVPPEPIRSVTVTPVAATLFTCPVGIIPRGKCFVGRHIGFTITGGITVTNGDAPSTIEVNGQSAVPSTAAGRPWSLVDQIITGPDQFDEVTDGATSATDLTTAPRCDNAFGPSCIAGPKETRAEQLQIVGPSSSTNSGIFMITTTWTAAPPPSG